MLWTIVETLCSAHHAEGLVNPKVRAKKSLRFWIPQSPEHVDSQNIKLKMGYRS
jgi:hypothetical protein